ATLVEAARVRTTRARIPAGPTLRQVVATRAASGSAGRAACGEVGRWGLRASLSRTSPGGKSRALSKRRYPERGDASSRESASGTPARAAGTRERAAAGVAGRLGGARLRAGALQEGGQRATRHGRRRLVAHGAGVGRHRGHRQVDGRLIAVEREETAPAIAGVVEEEHKGFRVERHL